MTAENRHDDKPATPGLPRRDLWLLPLIVACTVLGLLASAEVVARLFWGEQQADSCELNDGTGEHYRSRCHSRVKLAEGPWVDYATNRCGYRSNADCGPKPAGSLRVAVLGSSISRGYWVSYDESFAGRMESDLRRGCGRDVELQNLSMARSVGTGGPIWHMMADRLGEALALGPDAIVTVLAPYDLEQYTALPSAPTHRAAAQLSAREAAMAWFHENVIGISRVVLLAQHFFYLDLNRYIPLFLQHGDGADFLRPPFTSAWKLRLAVADETIGRIASQAGTAHVPMIVVFMPSRAEAALSTFTSLPPGIDPFALGQALSEITRRHKARFVDVTLLTRRLSDVGNLYYPVDSHPNGQGHALIAAALEAALKSDVPAFESCNSPKRSVNSKQPVSANAIN